MATPIFTHLEGSLAISRHEHVAVLYRDQSVAYRLVPFVAEGLRKGDLCQVIAAGAVSYENLQQIRARPDRDPRPLRRYYRTPALADRGYAGPRQSVLYPTGKVPPAASSGARARPRPALPGGRL